MDRGAWQATVHGVAKSWTQLSTHALTSLVCYSLKKAFCIGVNSGIDKILTFVDKTFLWVR